MCTKTWKILEHLKNLSNFTQIRLYGTCTVNIFVRNLDYLFYMILELFTFLYLTWVAWRWQSQNMLLEVMAQAVH